MSVAQALVALATEEWKTFGCSVRHLDESWELGHDESEPTFTAHINRYWRAVNQPKWDGATAKPWSGAFICWCVKGALDQAKSNEPFRVSSKHSKYIDRIRLHDRMSKKLVLGDVQTTPIKVGDLIWNSRGKRDFPLDFADAITRLSRTPKPDYFDSHVDIVVRVGDGTCDSIGGNVSNRDPGGSVTRSTWRLDAENRLIDKRKIWLGVVQNGL